MLAQYPKLNSLLMASALGSMGALTVRDAFYAHTVPHEQHFKYKLKSSGSDIKFPSTPPSNELSEMIEKNMFNSKGLFPKRRSQSEIEAELCKKRPAKRTSENVKLLGTIPIWGNPGLSIATLKDAGANLTLPVKVGEIFNDKIEILLIESKKVVFQPLQRCQKEFIDIPEDDVNIIIPQKRPSFRQAKADPRVPGPSQNDGRVRQTEPGQFSIQRSLIMEALSNPMALLQAARAEPAKKDGQVIGWKIMDITPGTLYTDLGIINDDIITRVNGRIIQNAGSAMKEFQKLKSAKKISIQVLRNGQPTNLSYNID